LHSAFSIRFLEVADIPRVARLIQKSLPTGPRVSDEVWHEEIRDVYLDNPWRNDNIGALVHEDGQGNITGFLGVVPRPLVMNGQSYVGAVCSDYCVEAGQRGMTGVRLIRRFLGGPQDISFTDEANETARAIWERSGGVTCHFLSVCWAIPLRPARAALSVARKRTSAQPLLTVMKPIAEVVDRVVNRFRKPIAPAGSPRLRIHEFPVAEALRLLPQIIERDSVYVEYDRQSLEWLIRRAARRQSDGRLAAYGFSTTEGVLAGWGILYAHSNGLSELLQIASRPEYRLQIYDHLMKSAYNERASALTGRLRVEVVPIVGRAFGCFQPASCWTMVHSKNVELVNSFTQGRAFVSRLDGEWCQHG
jgi:hypothetical protein